MAHAIPSTIDLAPWYLEQGRWAVPANGDFIPLEMTSAGTLHKSRVTWAKPAPLGFRCGILSTRKVGGVRFVKIGRISVSFCVSGHDRPIKGT